MNRYLIFMWTVFFFLACGSEKGDLPASETKAGRTIMVWLAGDNNLYSEVPRKLSALAKGFKNAATPNCRLLIYADRRGGYPQLIEILSDGNQKVLETYPVQNSASPETLNRSLQHMIELAPAKRYGMIVFSHATGWLPQGALDNPYLENRINTRTVLDDDGNQMSLADFANALPAGIKPDYILFENCFMAGIEVAYALKDKARRLLVSSAEILSPGFEEIYVSSLDCLTEEETDLTKFAEDFYRYRNSTTGNYRSAPISVINTSKLQTLASLAASIVKGSEPLNETETIGMQRFNRHEYTLFFDLEEYLTRLAPERQEEIHKKLLNVVEYTAATHDFMSTYPNGFAINRHCGLTVYIPQMAFPILNSYYEETTWYKATR